MKLRWSSSKPKPKAYRHDLRRLERAPRSKNPLIACLISRISIAKFMHGAWRQSADLKFRARMHGYRWRLAFMGVWDFVTWILNNLFKLVTLLNCFCWGNVSWWGFVSLLYIILNGKNVCSNFCRLRSWFLRTVTLSWGISTLSATKMAFSGAIRVNHNSSAYYSHG